MDKKVKDLLKRKIFVDNKIYEVTEYQNNEILKILEIYKGQKIKNRLKNIMLFIKYNVDGDWVERLSIITNVLKNDVMSDYALEIRYGKNNILQIKDELSKKVSHTYEKFINKYGNKIGEEKWKIYLESKKNWGLSACVKKYGDELGKEIWKNMLSKKINTMLERKKITPYRNGRTLVEYQERYGVEDGYKRWLERNKKQSYRFSKQYYIDTFGEIEGNVLWEKYKINMDKTSVSSFIKRYGEKLGYEKFYEYIDKTCRNGLLYSKISQTLFWELNDLLNNPDDINFFEKNGEEIFYVNSNGLKTIFVDFKYGNKIIEFDGDYWHSKKEQKEKDIKRDEFLKLKGYEILRVKETEYKNNKQMIIEECINFLKN